MKLSNLNISYDLDTYNIKKKMIKYHAHNC